MSGELQVGELSETNNPRGVNQRLKTRGDGEEDVRKSNVVNQRVHVSKKTRSQKGELFNRSVVCVVRIVDQCCVLFALLSLETKA